MPPETGPCGEIADRPADQEWAVFRSWAQRAGWRVPERELLLYRHELAASAFVLRDDARRPLGFVTVCRQQRNAWIGNLIVDPECRGGGLGRRLFEHAVAFLAQRGTSALWLTASQQGQPLYVSCGFREAGRIERWVNSAVSGHPSPDRLPAGDLYALVKADAAAWGSARAELLTLLSRGARIIAAGGSIAMLQPGADLNVMGPWLSADLCPRTNRTILAMALEACPQRSELAIDVRGGSPVGRLLAGAGFEQRGEAVLMVRGTAVNMRFDEVVALASLGSMG